MHWTKNKKQVHEIYILFLIQKQLTSLNSFLPLTKIKVIFTDFIMQHDIAMKVESIAYKVTPILKEGIFSIFLFSDYMQIS